MHNTLVIENVNEAYVRVTSSDEGLLYELREAFTFDVPGARFTPQYKARLWNGKIHLYDINSKKIYRGLVPHIIDFCKERDYAYEYETESDTSFSVKEATDFIKTLGLPFEPRDYQVDAFVHAIRSKRSLVLSSTGSGKSCIMYLILRYMLDVLNLKKILIIVPTISLVNQMESDFREYGLDSDHYIHKIYSGQDKDSEKKVFVSTWQSLFTLPKTYFAQFDAVFGDECHLTKSKSLTTIITQCINSKYRIGTTGTLDGAKTNKLVIEGLFGQVKKVSSTKELMDKKYLADFSIKCLILKHPDSVCQAVKDYTYQQEMEYLVLNEARNKFIKNLALSLEDTTLILFQFVEKHGKILHQMIGKELSPDRKLFFIHGGTEADDRENIRKLVETEKNAIIVASAGVFSTGVNIKNLHNIIFASPSKSRIRTLQSIGRGLRTSDTKSSAVLFDIADDLRWKKHENFTIKHFQERMKIYGEEKFKFKIYKIGLK